ncbi:hypothetical protein LWI29_014019 [Acer saccharum]|uniref:Protein FAR1-RELATED SEQUENCE n=1 Tax=Acer saccharum TaxID=4024 RepID=A0AA39S3U8_ACESA|nr:hypothetical protein LWI29_014019 [Acer saccharum]
MFDYAPKAIIIDQDKAMQKGIEVVFLEARHRWCLWHILKKLPEKLRGYKQYEYIKFAMLNVVYDSLSRDNFEENWKNFIKKYNLFDNKWLHGLYNERQRWVPAFVKDVFWVGMSTTQRSEGINAFFDGYVNSKTTFKQFVEQYENALRDKVEKEHQADFASCNSHIPCISHYSMEKQFQNAYTIAKFKEFQEEMKARLHCGISLNKKSGSNLEFEVKEDVKLVETCRRVTFMVYLDLATCEVNCSCHLFEFKGVLCRHAIMTLIDQEIFCVPKKYIFKRWRKDVKICHTKVKISYVDSNNKSEAHRFDKMCTYFYNVADLVVDSDENCNEVMKVLIELKTKLQGKSNVACCSEDNGISTNFMTNGKVLGGFAEEENRNILSPQQVRSKGHPLCKRKTSKIEKICQNKKEKNGKKKLDYQQIMKDSGVVESVEMVDVDNEPVLKDFETQQVCHEDVSSFNVFHGGLKSRFFSVYGQQYGMHQAPSSIPTLQNNLQVFFFLIVSVT